MKGELAPRMPDRMDRDLREKVINLSHQTRWILGGGRSLASIALLAALVAAVVVLMLWTSAKNFVPLYGSQEQYDKAAVLEILDREKLTFRIDNDTGNIMVPQNRLADARIVLAARGVRVAMPEGLANLGDKINMGTSQFMESMQYQHALEGELARTIMNMEGVRSSRVHLALPKRNLFIGRQEERPAASVMLDLAPGYSLDPRQVEAIVSLIVGSVSGLDPRAVSVMDQRGRLLSLDNLDDGGIGRETDKKLAFVDRMQRTIEQNANVMLMPILGEGNFRIQVSSDVDFSVVEETREAIDPASVVRTESIRSDTMLDQLALGIPGALANRPPLPAEAEGENNQRTSERNETSRQYESGRAVTHTRYEVGRLRSMSISVVVNEAVAGPGGWTEQRLTQIGDMVKTATGFQEERGDRFNIASFGFIAPEPVVVAEPLLWWQMPEIREYARYGFATLIGLALIIFGVRPLVKHITSRQRSEADERAAQNLTPAEDSAAGELEAVPDPTYAGTAATEQAEIASPFSGIALPQLGSELTEQIAHMQLLANKESDRVTAVIKYWVERGVNVESTNS